MKKKLVIEVLGVGLPNRGAELMARTVMQKFEQRYGECTFCTSQRMPSEERTKIGIPYCDTAHSSLIKHIKQLSPRNKRKHQNESVIGTIKDNDLDLVVDVSGFAYGDFWGAKKAQKQLGRRLRKWKENQIPLYILPQAFGPFNDPGFKTNLLPALEYASLVCPRDKQSQSYISELHKELKIYPDITLSLDTPALSSTIQGPYSLLIPNMKIFDSGAVSKEQYFSIASQFFSASRTAGITPYILNHEGQRDLELCKELSQTANIEILDPDNSIEIKHLIRNSKFVVSSRFHGAVTSLATSTPAVVLGWSHKYKELMNDFDLSEFVMDSPDANFLDIFELIKNDESRTIISRKIENGLTKSQEALAQMWESIFLEVDQLLVQ